MGTKEQYAQWIVSNADKKGTPEFETVSQAYQQAKQPVPQEVEKPKPSFTERVGERLGERAEKTGEMFTRATEGGRVMDIMKAPQVGVLAAGQVAGAGLDILTEGAKSAYGELMPESGKELVSKGGKYILSTDLGRMGVNAISKGADAYSKFAQQYPDAAMSLETLFNVSGVIGAKQGAKEILKEASALSKDAYVVGARTANKMFGEVGPEGINKAIASTARKGLEKAIRPGVEGKRTFGQTQQYFDKGAKAVESIVRNKGSLQLTDEFGDVVEGLPKTLNHFSQAIGQTKSNIFKQYDALAKGTSTPVDLAPIARQVQMFSNNKVINDMSPGLANYARELSSRLMTRGDYTPGEAQQAIATLNAKLDSFYKNPSFQTAGEASVAAIVANGLRKKLDDVITKATGQEYQQLKNEYGALKAIERDVNRRAIVDARKNVKGLIDFTDIYSGAGAVQALTSQNPALFASSATAKGIANYYKRLNSPNRAVEDMFKKVDGMMTTKEQITGKFTPRSKLGKSAVEAKESVDRLKEVRQFDPMNPNIGE